MTGKLAPVWFHVTDLEVIKGEGVFVYTPNGDKYLDCTSGIAVTSTGHCHPHVVKAIQKQAGEFIHSQVNCYSHNLLQPLADELEKITPKGIDTFFYANSGAEATEAAVKLAKQSTGKPNIIVFNGSFHGRTHMTMAMTTSKTGYRAGYSPLPSGIYVTPFPKSVGSKKEREDEIDACLDQLKYILLSQSAPSETAAIIMEPEQGEGGYIPAPARFMQGVSNIAKENNILFVADEVQSGFGRTGEFFAMDHYDVIPDILIMAKGIASGFPFSAIGASEELMKKWPTGSHGGTYGGNPIGCAAALATIEVMNTEGFMQNVRDRGVQLRNGLSTLAEKYSIIDDVRGFGLMVAAEFNDPNGKPDNVRCSDVINHCMQESKVLMMNAGVYGNIIRFMPPLIINEDEINTVIKAVTKALEATS
ncbi:MAG: aminotransferase class III-fold pyridoxal phosphate-dependent enzyme [Acidimicrobiia bacterium]|nr:aminotransferase class III-fold pyridoxal phosphate-dependent enzyme [Acidimicrobiia bacterium]